MLVIKERDFIALVALKMKNLKMLLGGVTTMAFCTQKKNPLPCMKLNLMTVLQRKNIQNFCKYLSFDMNSFLSKHEDNQVHISNISNRYLTDPMRLIEWELLLLFLLQIVHDIWWATLFGRKIESISEKIEEATKHAKQECDNYVISNKWCITTNTAL